LDEKLRAYAGLELNSRVVVSGAFGHVEIWDPARHQRMNESGTQELAGTE
jgi:DNA-binding transcriptional regulator/RsmH inhibitor MraZ